jgi:hypothetical protein
MATKTRTPVSGPVAVEEEQTGDGRLYARGAFQWDGVLPAAIVFDLEEGDHTAAVVGQMEALERRYSLTGGPTVIWADGYLEDSDVPEAQAFVDRARELLSDNPAVGVSLRYDSEVVEVRVKAELLQEEEVPMVAGPDGRVAVMKFAADDALMVFTSCRVRHLAIVDTAAMLMPDGERFAVAASGFIQAEGLAASALAGDWSHCHWMFDDPKFGSLETDPRLRYDPERGLWSCPPTLTDDGHYFGHITPLGICLRGRPDKCLTPPDGDLEGFMRGRAPAAGGLRTGVVTVVGRGEHGHCKTGVGVLAATQFYDGGWGAADVRVGRDQYGIWFSGMARPGITKEQAYQLCAADVSGHWEYPLNGVRNRATLVGLPADDVGGFPKGYLTYQEFVGGLAASAGIDVGEGCAPWDGIAASAELQDPGVLGAILEKLDNLSTAVGDLYAAHITKTADDR